VEPYLEEFSTEPFGILLEVASISKFSSEFIYACMLRIMFDDCYSIVFCLACVSLED